MAGQMAEAPSAVWDAHAKRLLVADPKQMFASSSADGKACTPLLDGRTTFRRRSGVDASDPYDTMIGTVCGLAVAMSGYTLLTDDGDGSIRLFVETPSRREVETRYRFGTGVLPLCIVEDPNHQSEFIIGTTKGVFRYVPVFGDKIRPDSIQQMDGLLEAPLENVSGITFLTDSLLAITEGAADKIQLCDTTRRPFSVLPRPKRTDSANRCECLLRSAARYVVPSQVPLRCRRR
jgi:hypothetical protein